MMKGSWHSVFKWKTMERSGGWWAGELMPSPQRTAATQSGLLSQPPTCQEISICPVQSFITFKHWVLSAVWKTHSVIRHDLTSTDIRSPYVITEKNQKKIFLKFWYFIFVCLGHMACRVFPSHAGSVSWRRCISVFVCHSNAAGRGIGSSKESRKQFNCYDFSFYYLWILASDGEKEKSFLFHSWGSGVVLSEDRRLWVLRKYWGGERVKSEKISVVLAEVK